MELLSDSNNSKQTSNDDKTIKSYATLIQKYDKSYKAPFIIANKKQWEGCLIILLIIFIMLVLIPFVLSTLFADDIGLGWSARSLCLHLL